MFRAVFLGLSLLATTLYHDSTPLSVTLNGEKWSIVQQNVIWHQDSTEWIGWTDCKHRVVTVWRFMPRAKKSLVVIHEFEHAMTCEHGEVHNEKFNNLSGGIHKGIYWSSEQWQRFIVDNPELIKWVLESGTE